MMNRINIESTVCERISRAFPEKRRESLAPHNPRRDNEAEKKTRTNRKKKGYIRRLQRDAATPRIFEFIKPANPIGKAA